MDVDWKCDGCGQELVTDSEYAGARVECPKCKKSLVVPSGETIPNGPTGDKLEERSKKGMLGKLFGGWKKQKMIEISGPWMIEALAHEPPLKIPLNPDLPGFFLQKKMSYLWPGDSEHVERIKSQEDPDSFLRGMWAIALFHHPNTDVVLATLRSPIPAEQTQVVTELAVVLADPIIQAQGSDIAVEIARTIWRVCTNDEAMIWILNVLNNVYEAGPTGLERQGVKVSLGILRQHCPPQRAEFFRNEVSGRFVPPTTLAEKLLGR